MGAELHREHELSDQQDAATPRVPDDVTPRGGVHAVQVFAGLVIVGFVLPWVNVAGLWTVPGTRLPTVATTAAQLGAGLADQPIGGAYLAYGLWLLPLLAGLIVYLARPGGPLVAARVVSVIVALLAVGAMIWALVATDGAALAFLGAGAHLTVVAALGLVAAAFGLVRAPGETSDGWPTRDRVVAGVLVLLLALGMGASAVARQQATAELAAGLRGLGGLLGGLGAFGEDFDDDFDEPLDDPLPPEPAPFDDDEPLDELPEEETDPEPPPEEFDPQAMAQDRCDDPHREAFGPVDADEGGVALTAVERDLDDTQAAFALLTESPPPTSLPDDWQLATWEVLLFDDHDVRYVLSAELSEFTDGQLAALGYEIEQIFDPDAEGPDELDGVQVAADQGGLRVSVPRDQRPDLPQDFTWQAITSVSDTDFNQVTYSCPATPDQLGN